MTGVAQTAYDTHLVSGLEPRHRVDEERMVGHAGHFKEAGIVEQRDIDAATVRTVMMHDFQPQVFHRLGGYKILQHTAVFNLGASDDGRAQRCGLRLHLRDGIGEIVDLLAVFRTVPFVASGRGELEVVLPVVVDGVEEVLKVIERHSEEHPLLVRGGFRGSGSCGYTRSRHPSYQESDDGERQKLSSDSHIWISL